MTAVVTSAGATTHNHQNQSQDIDWYAIDWQKANGEVRRLQGRIVKATQAGRWGKVKALQRLLTHSFSAKILAVRRVTENQGKNTPGVDRVIWNTAAKKARAVQLLNGRDYKALPLRRVYIPKSNGKQRPLGIPSMRCRAMQALHLLALDPVAEVTADLNSYGFRKERSCADAIEQCFNALSHSNGAEWVLEADIKSCFDRISHEWVLANIPMDKATLQKWLKAGFIEKHVLYPTEEGTPQGGIASPVIANLVLDGLEKQLKEKYPKNTPKGRKAKVNLVRYADDFIVTGSSKELLQDEVIPLVKQFLTERNLELSQEKTRITHIEDGFDFLGQNVRKYDGKLLIKPAKKNVSNFLAKVREFIKANLHTGAGKLITKLNPQIRGWANYHRHIVSRKTFAYVDHIILFMLLRWARRRHPKKGPGWRKAKYFQRVKNRDWVFFGQLTDNQGQPRNIQLVLADKVPIKRHIKIQSGANPYDSQWETYFEKRLDVKMEGELKGKRELIRLWREQQGLCPMCDQKITKLTGWHSHHIIWKVYGGTNLRENRVLLHPVCHTQLHNRPDLTVVKPGSDKEPSKGLSGMP